MTMGYMRKTAAAIAVSSFFIEIPGEGSDPPASRCEALRAGVQSPMSEARGLEVRCYIRKSNGRKRNLWLSITTK